MYSFPTTKRIILGLALILFSLPSQSQIKPEVTLGLRYNSDILFRTIHDNHPFAIEVGGGINYNEKWYTGLNANYFRTKSSISDAKHYLLELELRRSFGIEIVPKLNLNLAFRAGFILIDIYSYLAATKIDPYKTMTISASAGASYSVSEHFKFSVWPGLTWLPQESSPLSNKQRIGAFCGAGITYIF
ncbi:MAG: hypothetical protein KK926_03650 [Methanomethylovorans sp.]|nr:hypothetical protein [Methanomethylovorans sp.]